MILYDENSNLLGLSNDVVMFLGYDSLDDFNSYTKDIADLFLKKTGYIHKFDDFSWIDYVLHGGSSNKTALIKLKNQRIIEAELLITEILLTQKHNNMELFYQVRLKIKDGESLLDSEYENKPLSLKFNKPKQETKPQNNDFLQAHTLPKTKNDLVKKDIQERVYLEEFLEYADEINDEFVESINTKNTQKAKQISLKLKSIADLLRLDDLSLSLKMIYDADAKELSLLFCEYKKSLYKIKQRN